MRILTNQKALEDSKPIKPSDNIPFNQQGNMDGKAKWICGNMDGWKS